ncbi:DNA ligase 1 [Toxotes jaculatrix]|uniref:DNA ligase 1 n=1 Tax=Toxotes jaculatrix TaxID=941984 RepID=UPI001B3AEB05|nr:DNA ligase 1 [Toxotes jaculatrix]
MSPVKSQGRTNATKQKRSDRKGKQQKNVSQKGFKASQPPSELPNVKQKGRGNSTPLGDGTTGGVKGNKRNEGNGISQPQHEKDAKITGGRKKTTQLRCPPKALTTKPGSINNKLPTKPENKRRDRVTESEEEESESSAGSSVDATEDGTSNDEKEVDQGSNEEPDETEGSKQSSEEEAEASDTQRDTEQTENEESDKEFSEEAKSVSESEVEPVAPVAEEEENEKEVEASEAVVSDGGEDKEITQEDMSEKPTADKACRRRRQTPRLSKPAQGSKNKMFKKTKADKQAEKEEKQRAKAEKKRLEKEAKQKAKEEKKNKKKPQKEDKPGSETEETQSIKGSLSKADTAKGKLASKIKNGNKKDPLVEADPEEEEEEAELTLSKAIKGQNQIMLLKAKGKDLKAVLEPEEQQDAESVIKGRPQNLLLGKVKMASLRDKANKMLAKPDEDTSASGTINGGSSKPKEGLIARRKGMATLHRVSGWIQKKMPRGINFRKKLSAWTKAIGVSRWLSLRAIKQKQGTRKSKGHILKHRMAMRVASKTSLASRKNKSVSENKMAKEKGDPQGKAGEGGEEAATTEEKEVEAKYAVESPLPQSPNPQNQVPGLYSLSNQISAC